MGIATGTVVPDDLQSCTIDIPSNLATGSWTRCIANGVASDPVVVQIAAQDCFFVVDSSTFSIGEIDTYVKGSPPTPAVFNPAFFVVIEGYTPAEIGINTAKPIPPQLLNPPIVPSVPTPFPMHMQIAFVGPMIPEDPTLPSRPQRFTFLFSITFNDDTVFSASATDVTLNASFTTSGTTVGNSATIVLTPNPNPYLLHGDQNLTPPEPWYLSQDLCVFQVIENGSSVFGTTLPNTGTPQSIATTFIQAAVTNLRNDVGTTRADFDAIPQDEDSEALQLLPNVQRGNRQWRRTIGTFKLTIPVSTKGLLRVPEERYYSVMKWVAEAIPTSNRWYPVMQRYLSQIAGRITFMGGNPAQIPATGTGIWPILPLPAHVEHEFVGKIEALFYDRFADFDGFRLQTLSGAEHRFNSREPGIAELAQRAWIDRILIRVETELSTRTVPRQSSS